MFYQVTWLYYCDCDMCDICDIMLYPLAKSKEENKKTKL